MDVASEVVAEMKESQNERDNRVEELWKRLDPAGLRELDFKGLQKGLRRIDHRKTLAAEKKATNNIADRLDVGGTAMKNADQMLQAIIGMVDTSGDGKIQYEGGFQGTFEETWNCC